MKKSIGARTAPLPAPAWVIGTYDEQGKPNIMTAAWAGICCSKPPCAAISLRQATYTYDNIVSQEAFTINVPSLAYLKETDYVGIVSGRNVDKFEKTGLTPLRSEIVNAPYIAEFPVVMECRLLHTLVIGLHTQFIGEVLDIKVEEALLDDKNRPIVEKLALFVFTGDYFAVGSLVGKAFSIGKDEENHKPV